MNFFTRILTIVLIAHCGTIGIAQETVRTKKSPIVCYASSENIATRVERPQLANARNAGIPSSANIEVVYNGFSPQAQAAFQTAIDIWESLLTSPVTIRVSANWTTLGSGVLGSAGPTDFVSNFEGAPNMNVGYPIALAEKLAGKNLNEPTDFDIVASFNSNFNWYYNSTGTPAPGQYDLISVVLHELGHGLGFVDSYNLAAGVGEYGSFRDGEPLLYDINIEDQAGVNIYQNSTSPSSPLGFQLISNNLFYNSPVAIANNSGLRPKIYAPATWSAGSSIAHLDEFTYTAGNINSLMSPQFAAQEVIHHPGPITLNMFKDLGWSTIYINHEPVPSTENTSSPAFNVVAVITDDNSENYNLETDEIFLHYYTSLNPTPVSIQMDPTGQADEYSALLPAPGGNELDYFYYISAGDNLSRTITKPGKINTPLQAANQGYYTFHVGADTDAPVISHTPAEFISFQDEEVKIEAEITDRYDLTSVMLEYSVAGIQQTNASMTFLESEFNPLTGLTTYHYEISIPTASLLDGDEFAYRIVAQDNSSNSNIGTSPSSDLHRLTFKGLKQTQNLYSNNFDLESDDFIGDSDEFSITQPSGFNNPAIHTVHPYPEGGNAGSFNYIYTLRVPVLVHSVEELATIKFDEIVLVEPGESGSVFGTEAFYDYVVVEGSKDGGETWITVADGYDSRDYAPWLTKYNSASSGSNSTAVGDPSLFRTRKLNLLNKFDSGDEVIVRFRLYSDPGAAGWGWAIDNLKIQIDDEAPELLHQHVDYVKEGTSALQLVSKITDNIYVEKAILEVGVNSQPPETLEEIINDDAVEVTFSLTNLGDLSVGDKIIYKLSSVDTSGNTITIPAVGYFEVPVVDLHDHVDQYTNDFNSETNDFVGNFFSIEQPAGFQSGAIHSSHNYLIGFGEDHVSDFTYTLKKSVVLSPDNARIRFDEVAIVESQSAGVVFGTPAFNDYVIVEGSKDDGDTWQPFIDGYDANDQSVWLTAFTNGSDGSPALFRTRVIDMTENGNFAPDDHVIIRFRLFSDNVNNGWGWAIDNLYIQDVITGAEKELESTVSVYPNPAKENITIEATGLAIGNFNIQLLSAHGKSVYQATEQPIGGKFQHSISASTLPAGVYIVKIGDGINSITKKIIKIN